MVENSCGVMQDVLCLHEVVKHMCGKNFFCWGLDMNWEEL